MSSSFSVVVVLSRQTYRIQRTAVSAGADRSSVEGALQMCGPGPERTRETKGGSAPWQASSPPPVEVTWELPHCLGHFGSPSLRRGGNGTALQVAGSWGR